MIVTRTWLEEFIDLEGISNDELYATFNAIGLEVDSLTEYTIPKKVVVGRIVACGKHPDADKLSLCQIDIGTEEPQQIICGAANVVDAEYVAVATIGAVLPGDFKIKPAKLRGVESFGMVCSSEELGLPKTGEGIMILDESIGDLTVGRALNTYPKIADTVIELELTANRGDCLSVHGVARDLSAALDRPIQPHKGSKIKTNNVGIARKISIQSDKSVPTNLQFFLSENEGVRSRFLTTMRLAFVGHDIGSGIENIIRYTTQATGVILRAYDAKKLYNSEGKITLIIHHDKQGMVQIMHNDVTLSTVGIDQRRDFQVGDGDEEILFEASYIDPTLLVEMVATQKLETDPLYYNTSRGSEPDLMLGSHYLQTMCSTSGNCCFYEGSSLVQSKMQERTVGASVEMLGAIIGNPISKTTVHTILQRLGFEMRASNGDTFGIRIPLHRHDIVHVQDLAEEVLRITGIDNIVARPLALIEQDRLTQATRRYRIKRDIRQRAVSAGFYEAVTYAFTDRTKLEMYGFPTVEASLEMVNPIVEEFNTLRTTLMTNLLDAAKRNVSYGIRRIPLFEVGAVFDSQRQQTEKIAFVWSGYLEIDTVTNQGKPSPVDFAAFVDRVSQVIGAFELVPCEETHALIHPYQSASILRKGETIGYLAKLHPSVAKAYDLGETFIAELMLDALEPEHVLAHPVSNYQGVYKDISVLIDKAMPYRSLQETLRALDVTVLKRFYVVDVYEDASFGGQKSVTIRLFLQSEAGTLSDVLIEESVDAVLTALESQCQAVLR
jgi:phenylalanyl-tRNA synthetase beta chain